MSAFKRSLKATKNQKNSPSSQLCTSGVKPLYRSAKNYRSAITIHVKLECKIMAIYQKWN